MTLVANSTAAASPPKARETDWKLLLLTRTRRYFSSHGFRIMFRLIDSRTPKASSDVTCTGSIDCLVKEGKGVVQELEREASQEVSSDVFKESYL
jgi:hypothetical protein